MDGYLAEIDHLTPLMNSIGQDPTDSVKFIREAYPNAEETNSDSIFRLKFLSSPVRIIGNSNREVTGLELEETTLINDNGVIRARGTGRKSIMAVDTVIFAIGDSTDPDFGLPFDSNEFVKNPKPRFPINGISYESFDPVSLKIIEDVFLAGWARKASDGLVGNARKDGVNAAQVIEMYLETLDKPPSTSIEEIQSFLSSKNKRIVDKSDLNGLLQVENKIASESGSDIYKFATNEEMMSIIENNRISMCHSK
jgi:ferredoxin--NADP+ reductase